MERLLVRPAEAADIGHLVEFNRAIALETEGKTLDLEVLRRGVEAAMRDPDRGFYLVAELDGRVAGCTLVTREWSDWRNGWFWWIQSVYVAPTARRQGVFAALFSAVSALARERGAVRGLRLYVERENANAQAVYRRLGMAETSYRLFETQWGQAT